MQTKDDVARELAEGHFDVEPELQQVFRLRATEEAESRPTEPIKLLEVHAGTPSAGVLPLYFGPTKMTPYSTVIVQVTPQEYEQIRSRDLILPKGWIIGEELPRPVLTQVG